MLADCCMGEEHVRQRASLAFTCEFACLGVNRLRAFGHRKKFRRKWQYHPHRETRRRKVAATWEDSLKSMLLGLFGPFFLVFWRKAEMSNCRLFFPMSGRMPFSQASKLASLHTKPTSFTLHATQIVEIWIEQQADATQFKLRCPLHKAVGGISR